MGLKFHWARSALISVGQLLVAADHWFSTLWLDKLRCRDTAVYCCALRDMGRAPGTVAGQEPRWVGLDGCGRGTAPAGPAGKSGSDGFPACPPGTGQSEVSKS